MCERKAPIVGYEPGSEPSPEPLWEKREHTAILQQAIEELSPRLRMAFVLRIWDELPYEEIAL
ncbi:RNA polymerase sigma factor, partial [Salmonella sp. SAL4449]|uniref:RNA polymerase sigma factor n=1 Tax=Salmonella sp. SAL4449 TaxID=3159904 RepID=UPI00397E0F2F